MSLTLPPVKRPTPYRDGVRQHRNSVLLEVMDEIYKLYSHKSSVDRHDIIDTIKKLKV